VRALSRQAGRGESDARRQDAEVVRRVRQRGQERARRRFRDAHVGATRVGERLVDDAHTVVDATAAVPDDDDERLAARWLGVVGVCDDRSLGRGTRCVAGVVDVAATTTARARCIGQQRDDDIERQQRIDVDAELAADRRASDLDACRTATAADDSDSDTVAHASPHHQQRHRRQQRRRHLLQVSFFFSSFSSFFEFSCSINKSSTLPKIRRRILHRSAEMRQAARRQHSQRSAAMCVERLFFVHSLFRSAP
jgi:hypothetical protein